MTVSNVKSGELLIVHFYDKDSITISPCIMHKNDFEKEVDIFDGDLVVAAETEAINIVNTMFKCIHLKTGLIIELFFDEVKRLDPEV